MAARCSLRVERTIPLSRAQKRANTQSASARKKLPPIFPTQRSLTSRLADRLHPALYPSFSLFYSSFFYLFFPLLLFFSYSLFSSIFDTYLRYCAHLTSTCSVPIFASPATSTASPAKQTASQSSTLSETCHSLMLARYRLD